MTTTASAHAERRLEHTGQLRGVVADDHLEADVVADGVQALRHDQRVRVDAKRRQHLAADGNDAGFHESGNWIIWVIGLIG